MRTLHGLDVKMHPTVLLAYRGIFRIGEGTRGAVAQAGGGVGVFAELFFVLVGSLGFGDGGFVGAELVVDYLPDHFVVLHGGKFMFCCGVSLGAVCGCVVVSIL